MKTSTDHIKRSLESIRKLGLYPDIKCVNEGATEPITIIAGKEYINFCSNNYLGLSTHPQVIKGALLATEKYGIGPGTSRLLSGNIQLLEDLDCLVAELVQTEAALTIPTGYIANSGVVSALVDSSLIPVDYKMASGVVLSDEYNHASIIDGCRQSSAKVLVFKHNNIHDLEEKLLSVANIEPKLIVTEGVFSLEAQVSPLASIVELAKKYKAMLLIDDAHSIGILGQKGGGTVQQLGLVGKVDVIMGSFSKALGGMGGFVAGSKNMIDYLKVSMRSFVYSSPISAPIAGGLIESIKLCINEEGLREKLFNNYLYLYNKLKNLEYSILGDGICPVIPLMIYDDHKAIEVSRKLFEKGILLECFRAPAVPKNTARLRIVPMAHHKLEHLERLVDELAVFSGYFQARGR